MYLLTMMLSYVSVCIHLSPPSMYVVVVDMCVSLGEEPPNVPSIRQFCGDICLVMANDHFYLKKEKYICIYVCVCLYMNPL